MNCSQCLICRAIPVVMKKHFCDLMNGYKVLFLFLVQYHLTGRVFLNTNFYFKIENPVRNSLCRERGECHVTSVFFCRLVSQQFFVRKWLTVDKNEQMYYYDIRSDCFSAEGGKTVKHLMIYCK